MSERHFTEEQVAEIIRKAAEMQVQKGRTTGNSPGSVSLSEVRRIAQELGIASSAVDRAIAQSASWDSNDTGDMRSVSRTLERIIDGNIAEDDYATVMEEFVPSPNSGGTSISVGKTVNYTAMVGLAGCNVHLSQKNTRTTLRVKSDAWISAIPSFLPAFILSLVSGAIIFEETNLPPDQKPLVFVFALIAIIGLAFFLFKSFVGYSNRKITMLTDSCAKRLSERTVEPSEEPLGLNPEVDDLQNLRQRG